jgi:triacylglycerol lipase
MMISYNGPLSEQRDTNGLDDRVPLDHPFSTFRCGIATARFAGLPQLYPACLIAQIAGRIGCESRTNGSLSADKTTERRAPMTTCRLSDATSHFDLPIALRLAAAAELIYAEAETVALTATQRWESTHFHFVDVESTQCLAAADEHNIVVCFRGTQSDDVHDWIVDLAFELVDGPLGGRVHAGFYDALSCVWHLLDDQVRRLQEEQPRKLWVTGHSLGAALATLAVARWREQDRPVAGLYTFGQPRTGDRTFARNFDFVFRPYAFRIVNHLDVVTRTPPRSLGYHHAGTFVYMNEDGQLTHDMSWWQRFLEGWHGAIETILDWGREGIEDHRMTNYRQGLELAGKCQTVVTAARNPATAAPHHGDHQAALIKPRRRAA